MQKAFHQIHTQKNSKGRQHERYKHHHDSRYISFFYTILRRKRKEHLSKLRMSQTKSPQPQIGSSMRDRSQHKFYSLDNLMHHYFRKVKFLLMFLFHIRWSIFNISLRVVCRKGLVLNLRGVLFVFFISIIHINMRENFIAHLSYNINGFTSNMVGTAQKAKIRSSICIPVCTCSPPQRSSP